MLASERGKLFLLVGIAFGCFSILLTRKVVRLGISNYSQFHSGSQMMLSVTTRGSELNLGPVVFEVNKLANDKCPNDKPNNIMKIIRLNDNNSNI